MNSINQKKVEQKKPTLKAAAEQTTTDNAATFQLVDNRQAKTKQMTLQQLATQSLNNSTQAKQLHLASKNTNSGSKVIQLESDDDDDDDQGIGERIGRRRAEQRTRARMTPRQREVHRAKSFKKGIDPDDARGVRRKDHEKKIKTQRERRLENARRKLWDGQTRPGFTAATWRIMLGSVASHARAADGVMVYQCQDGSFCPRKRDRVGKENYVTLDHHIDWKRYIYSHAAPEEDGRITKASASVAYNDTSNLVVMTNVNNSSKNAPQGVFD